MTRVFLRVSLTMVSLFAFSGPSLANSWVNGHSSAGNVTLNSADNWTVIRRAAVVIPFLDGAPHGCVATASADVATPVGAGGHYLFVLSRNNANPFTDGASERFLELVDHTDVNDPNAMPVSTTQHYLNLTNQNGANGAGMHTFYLLGRKVAAGDANTTVLDASLSVMCVDTPVIIGSLSGRRRPMETA